MPLTPEILADAAAIEAFARDVRGATEVAFDTEFHGEKSYTPALMLVQMAVGERVVLLDPLGGGDVGQVFRALAEGGALVVGHALKHDLLIVFRRFGVLPARIFDTQVAAAFLGFGDQCGLARLLKDVLAVDLKKAMTMANWGRRPLTPELISYASDDVLHLVALKDALVERLRARGREAWVTEELTLTLDPGSYALPPLETAWLRVKGRRPSRPRDCAVLQALAAERERLARERDEPVGRVLPDDLLLDLMERKPQKDKDIVGHTHRRSAPGLEQHAGRWITAIRHGVAAEPPAQPLAPNLSGDEELVLSLCTLLIKRVADREELAPGLLRVEALAQLVGAPLLDEPAFTTRLGLSAWRSALVAPRLHALLSGRLRLGVARGAEGKLGLVEVAAASGA